MIVAEWQSGTSSWPRRVAHLVANKEARKTLCKRARFPSWLVEDSYRRAGRRLYQVAYRKVDNVNGAGLTCMKCRQIGESI